MTRWITVSATPAVEPREAAQDDAQDQAEVTPTRPMVSEMRVA